MDHVVRLLSQEVIEIIPLVMRSLAAELRSTGHTLAPSHFRLLTMLSLRPWNLGELADHEMVSPATISRSMATLEERGWIERRRSELDRRVVQAQLTDRGQAVLDDMRHQAEIRVAAMLGELNPQDCERLRRGLLILRGLFEPVLKAGQVHHQAEP